MPIDSNALINTAKKWLGTPYSWGGGTTRGPGYGFAQGAGIKGFDCSSLVQYVYAQYGVNLPRVTYDQWKVGAQVSFNNLQSGDLVFFRPGSRGPEHVGMYIGNGKFLHAPKTGDVVKISDITDPSYRSTFMGGRRVAQVKGGGNYDSSNDPGGSGMMALINPGGATQNPKSLLDPQDFAAHYGWAYSFLQSDAGLKGVFQEAVKNSWTASRFQAEVQKTSWWRQTSEGARNIQIMKNTDPATYQANLNSAIAEVQEKANSLGAYPSKAMIEKIAKDGLDLGYNDAQITQALVKFVDFSKGHMGGQAGMIEDRVREAAYRNGLQVTDQSIKNNAVMILKGQKSMEQYIAELKNQAIGMYPAYKDQLNAGIDLAQIAQPYIDAMAQTLERPADSISVFDPMIKKALSGLNKDGQAAGMTLGDFTTMLKSSKGWEQTSNARNSVMSTTNYVLQSMGLRS